MKRCARCRRERPLDEFHKNARRPDGRQERYGRGIPGMEKVKTEEPKGATHRYQLFYRAPMGQWDCQEGLDLWKQKHGGAR